MVDYEIPLQVTLGIFPSHPPPLRQQMILPAPTTLLPHRPSTECFLRPSTHLVGLATMPHNLGLAQWVRQNSGKFLSLHPPAKANSWPFWWEKEGSLGPVPASWETCGDKPPCPKDEANRSEWPGVCNLVVLGSVWLTVNRTHFSIVANGRLTPMGAKDSH